uniref:Peroxiredoxin-like 2A n=1 Tax=Acanthochromis polyacanthus TaxID=80966 RepID=A0A3Q1F9U9_9TELE
MSDSLQCFEEVSRKLVVLSLDGFFLTLWVKDNVGTEVHNVKPFFKGEIFLEEKRQLYEKCEEKMGLLEFLCVGVWMNGLRVFKNGFSGNVLGEGFVLGGVFVIRRGEQGILLEHREIEFGHKVNTQEVI